MAESYNLCLDIGGTKVLGVIFNSKKEVVYRLKKKTKAGGDSSENVEQVIINVVKELISTSGIKKSDIHAIAAGAPGVIDQDKGVVLSHPISHGEITTSENRSKRSSDARSISATTLMSACWVNTSSVPLKATRTLLVSSSEPEWAAD